MREDWLQALARKLEWTGLPLDTNGAAWLSDQSSAGDFDSGDVLWLFELLDEASSRVLFAGLVSQVIGFSKAEVASSLARPTMEIVARVDAVCRALYAIIRSERSASTGQVRMDLAHCLAYKHALLGALSTRVKTRAVHFAKAIGYALSASADSTKMAAIHNFWSAALSELKKQLA